VETPRSGLKVLGGLPPDFRQLIELSLVAPKKKACKALVNCRHLKGSEKKQVIRWEHFQLIVPKP